MNTSTQQIVHSNNFPTRNNTYFKIHIKTVVVFRTIQVADQ